MSAINSAKAIDFATELLEKSGVESRKAERSARAIVASDVWGNASHGLMRLGYYLKRIEAGGINPKAELEMKSQRVSTRVFDGQNGLGHWQLWQAAREGVDLAKESGISLISIANSNHCGALGVYLYPALDEKAIAIIFTNGPAVMPAVGGNAPLLSTSPIAAGIPATQPMIIDLATSAVARGKIAAKAKEGGEIPEGWVVDREGRAITDAKEALHGMLAPLGGAKGFALGILVESMVAGITAGKLSQNIPDMFNPEDDSKGQEISHSIITIDVDSISGAAGSARFDELAESIRNSGGRTPGSSRVHPEKISDQEITIAEPVKDELNIWSEKLGSTKKI
jgi:(2R)-3-sulfolactate dehydrogenase (NADP+)